jgi:hypothetical protein
MNRQTLLPPALALLALAIFALCYLGAFHAPTPQAVPIGVLNAQAAARVDAAGGAFTARIEPSVDALRRAVESRSVQAGLAGDRLYIASGGGYIAAATIERSFQAQTSSPRVVDLAPLAQGDHFGTTLFYVAVAAVFGGYLAATIAAFLPDPRGRSRGIERVASLVAFSPLAGAILALVVHLYGAIDGHLFAIWWISSLLAFAAAATTAALQTILGVGGTGLALSVLIILGTTASGGPYPLTFEPAFFHALGPYLPQQAAISALRGAVYFDGAGLGRVAVLATYAAAGTLGCLAPTLLRTEPTRSENHV